MGSIQSRAKPLESAISVCLLAVLFLIGVGVFLKQFDYEITLFGISQNSEAGAVRELPLRSLVPAGFEALSEIEVYNSENLYEKIDGRAPFYTESGFEKLLSQRFVSEDDQSLWMELYVYNAGYTRRSRDYGSLCFGRYSIPAGNTIQFQRSGNGN